MILSIMTAMLLLSSPAFAQKPLKISIIPQSDYGRLNPDSNNLNTSSETAWQSRESDGTRGGGDSKLYGSIARATHSKQEQLRLANAFASRDWIRSYREDRREAVTQMLLTDPIRRLKAVRDQIAENCAGGKSNEPVLSADFSSLCIPAGLATEQYPAMWRLVLTAMVGEEWMNDIAHSDENPMNLKPAIMLQMKYNMSLPAAFDRVFQCIQYNELSIGTHHSSESFKNDTEVRKHPDGSYVVRTWSGEYEICF